MDDVTTLQGVWFVLIAVLWLGYFVLEGFDFGVGMLIRKVGKTDSERRAPRSPRRSDWASSRSPW